MGMDSQQDCNLFDFIDLVTGEIVRAYRTRWVDGKYVDLPVLYREDGKRWITPGMCGRIGLLRAMATRFPPSLKIESPAVYICDYV